MCLSGVRGGGGGGAWVDPGKRTANFLGEFLNHAGPLITQALGMKVDSRAIELIIDTHASAPHLHDGPARAIEQVIAG